MEWAKSINLDVLFLKVHQHMIGYPRPRGYIRGVPGRHKANLQFVCHLTLLLKTAKVSVSSLWFRDTSRRKHDWVIDQGLRPVRLFYSHQAESGKQIRHITQ